MELKKYNNISLQLHKLSHEDHRERKNVFSILLYLRKSENCSRHLFLLSLELKVKLSTASQIKGSNLTSGKKEILYKKHSSMYTH